MYNEKCLEVIAVPSVKIYLTVIYNIVLVRSSATLFCLQRCMLVSQGRIYVTKTVEIAFGRSRF